MVLPPVSRKKIHPKGQKQIKIKDKNALSAFDPLDEFFFCLRVEKPFPPNSTL